MIAGFLKIIDGLIKIISIGFISSNFSLNYSNWIIRKKKNDLGIINTHGFNNLFPIRFIAGILQVIDGVFELISFGNIKLKLAYAWVKAVK